MSSDIPTSKFKTRYGGEDEDDSFMAPATPKKADWKSNPLVPLGQFNRAREAPPNNSREHEHTATHA